MKLKGTVKRALFAGLSILTVATAIVSVAPSELASAITCRNIVNPTEVSRFYEGSIQIGVTAIYTVPGSSVSACNDINIRNIYREYSTTPNCQYFRVRFYPSSGGSYVNSWKWACSVPPSGPDQVIASSVLNGTKYRVEVQTELLPPSDFTIRD